MKRIRFIILLLLITGGVYGQQFPFMEGYNVNPFTMTPSYAGLIHPKTLFVDYRSDWSGMPGGPTTYQLSYSQRMFEKVGIGGRFIYDKTDIFKQTILMGTYTYEINFSKDHFINLGLSAGLYRNSIDLGKYYNSTSYVQDPVLTYGLEKSKIKFATDASVLYRFKGFEGGILFSNVMFGSAKYNSSDIAYKPMKNYMVHTAFNFSAGKAWEIKPFVLVRGGQNYPVQLEVASQVAYNKSFWGTLVYRTGGIFGAGLGGEVLKGVLLNYSYNLSTNVALNTFGSHQITLGIRLIKPNENKPTKTQKRK
jgi:type IX secretion system PorP/SprF family membrane protein